MLFVTTMTSRSQNLIFQPIEFSTLVLCYPQQVPSAIIQICLDIQLQYNRSWDQDQLFLHIELQIKYANHHLDRKSIDLIHRHVSMILMYLTNLRFNCLWVVQIYGRPPVFIVLFPLGHNHYLYIFALQIINH